MPEQRAQERQKQAGQSSGVFQHDREKTRILGLFDELERLRVAACGVELAQRNRKRHALDDSRNADVEITGDDMSYWINDILRGDAYGVEPAESSGSAAVRSLALSKPQRKTNKQKEEL